MIINMITDVRRHARYVSTEIAKWRKLQSRGSIANYVIDILRIDSAIAVATVTNTSIERPTILVKVTTALNCIAESVRTIFL